MDSLKSLDFLSFIIFSDDPWSLLVSFCQLFRLPLVVQCCNVICEWPLKVVKDLKDSKDLKDLQDLKDLRCIKGLKGQSPQAARRA